MWLAAPKNLHHSSKAYVKEFAFKTLDSNDFKQFFTNYFASADGIADIDWDAWLRGTGMPPVDNVFDQSLAEAVIDLKRRWVDGGSVSKEGPERVDSNANHVFFGSDASE